MNLYELYIEKSAGGLLPALGLAAIMAGKGTFGVAAGKTMAKVTGQPYTLSSGIMDAGFGALVAPGAKTGLTAAGTAGKALLPKVVSGVKNFVGARGATSSIVPAAKMSAGWSAGGSAAGGSINKFMQPAENAGAMRARLGAIGNAPASSTAVSGIPKMTNTFPASSFNRPVTLTGG